jgi:hypothetical protein
MSTANYEYKISDTRVPMFDGEKENRSFYRKKLELYIARLGLALLLDEVHGDNIPKDTEAVPSTDPNKSEHERKVKENRKAAGILLNSIYTITDDRERAGSVPHYREAP